MFVRTKRHNTKFTYQFDRISSFVSAFIMLITNLFWLVFDFITKNPRGVHGLWAHLAMILLCIVCVFIIALFKSPMKELTQRHLYMLFSMLICFEVTLVNLAEVQSYSSNGEALTGISLVTMYLFIVVFIVYPSLVDRIVLNLFLLASLIVPGIVYRDGSYSILKNLMLGVSIIFVSFVFGEVVRKLGTTLENFEEEKKRNERLVVQSLTSIANTIDAKDSFTKGHSKRVAIYAHAIAREMGLSQTEQEQLYLSGLVHDIGKTSIPSSLLQKAGKLTAPEYEIIKTHTLEGYRILKDLKEIPYISEAAHWHHERIDGKGYPEGLIGDQIPLYARIVAVADTYDAMTHNRSYRNALSSEEVMNELIRVRGTKLDSEICGTLISLINHHTLPICSEAGDIISE